MYIIDVHHLGYVPNITLSKSWGEILGVLLGVKEIVLRDLRDVYLWTLI